MSIQSSINQVAATVAGTAAGAEKLKTDRENATINAQNTALNLEKEQNDLKYESKNVYDKKVDLQIQSDQLELDRDKTMPKVEESRDIGEKLTQGNYKNTGERLALEKKQKKLQFDIDKFMEAQDNFVKQKDAYKQMEDEFLNRVNKYNANLQSNSKIFEKYGIKTSAKEISGDLNTKKTGDK